MRVRCTNHTCRCNQLARGQTASTGLQVNDFSQDSIFLLPLWRSSSPFTRNTIPQNETQRTPCPPPPQLQAVVSKLISFLPTLTIASADGDGNSTDLLRELLSTLRLCHDWPHIASQAPSWVAAIQHHDFASALGALLGAGVCCGEVRPSWT